MAQQEKPAVAEALTAAVAEDVKTQGVEWGTFVATQAIDFNGARAYNTGDPVPVSNVRQYDYEQLGWVKRV